MSTKTNNKACKCTQQKKNTAKHPTQVQVNGNALKKAIADRETAQNKPQVEVTKKFHIWDVYGVKFMMDDNNVPTRRVGFIEVTSDHDTANEPELRNRLIQQAEDKLISEGYCMTDVDAMEEALKTAERVIDSIRHDLKYAEACPGCVANDLEVYVKWLEYLRTWRNRRFNLADELGGTCNLPPVIPDDYIQNWHVDHEKHRLVRNCPKPQCQTTTVIKAKSLNDLPKEIVETIGQLIGKDKLAQLQLPSKPEVKKLPPAKK